MPQSFFERARCHLLLSQKALEDAAGSEQFLKQLGAISDAIVQCFKAGGKVLLAGNGGSAADAQHIAGEFLSRLNFDRAPLPAIALTVDTSVLTAIGNDYGYDQLFERQLQGLGRPGDVLICLSTSGRSSNILRALRKGRAMGLVTIGFCGAQDSDMPGLCDIALCAPSEQTPLIQQIHITAAHIICGEVERMLFQADTRLERM